MSLECFLKATELKLNYVYTSKRYYIKLCRTVGHLEGEVGDDARMQGLAIVRMFQLDEHNRLWQFLKWLSANTLPVASEISVYHQFFATQLRYHIWYVINRSSLQEGWQRLWGSKPLLNDFVRCCICSVKI